MTALIFVPRFRKSEGTLNLSRPSVCHKNFNLGHNFGTVTGRALIFGMCVPCDKTFPMVPCRDLDGDLQGQICCRAGDHNSLNLLVLLCSEQFHHSVKNMLMAKFFRVKNRVVVVIEFIHYYSGFKLFS